MTNRQDARRQRIVVLFQESLGGAGADDGIQREALLKRFAEEEVLQKDGIAPGDCPACA